jgi:hypothetical protein
MTVRRRRRERQEARTHEPVAAAPVELLDLAALPARGSEAARVAAARAAQRAVGNHAVARVLARDPNPALEGKRTPRAPKPQLRSGREVDAIFDASPYFKDLVGAKLKKVSLDKAMKIDSEADFEKAWVEYAIRSVNPQTDRNFSEEEAKKFLVIKGVRAFQDEDRREVHIRKERADLGTQLHEGLHLFSADKWKRPMGYNVNEGVTEYFTRKIGPEVDVERDDASFLREYTSATHLVTAATEPVVAAAYFEGEIPGLKKAVDAARSDGTWEKWLGFLDANDFKSANALLKP